MRSIRRLRTGIAPFCYGILGKSGASRICVLYWCARSPDRRVPSRRSGYAFQSANTRVMMRVPPTRRRSGSAVVEFTVVLPILVALLLGIWEIGRMVQVKQIIYNAAREGARAASTGYQTFADVDLTVRHYLAAAGLKTDGYT